MSHSFDYGFDEEARGFGAPPKLAGPSLRPAQKVAAGIGGLGGLTLVLYMAGLDLGGGWAALGATLGPVSLGASRGSGSP